MKSIKDFALPSEDLQNLQWRTMERKWESPSLVACGSEVMFKKDNQPMKICG